MPYLSYCPLVRLLHPFDDGRRAHSRTNAERDERRRFARTFELVERRAKQHGASRAKRMAHRDRAAIHIEFPGIDIESLHKTQDDGCESFIDLEKINVLDRHACAG